MAKRTKKIPLQFLGPRAIEELTGRPLTTVKKAMDSGALPVSSEHLGAGDSVTSRGVLLEDVQAWAQPKQRRAW